MHGFLPNCCGFCRERERRLEARSAAQQLSTEELERKIQTKVKSQCWEKGLGSCPLLPPARRVVSSPRPAAGADQGKGEPRARPGAAMRQLRLSSHRLPGLGTRRVRKLPALPPTTSASGALPAVCR